MKPIFLHNWETKEDMITDFEGFYFAKDIPPDCIAKYDHVDVILASYCVTGYEGGAFVLFRNNKDGQLYEIHGSHCSCYGLENQWEEDLASIESLRKRVNEGTLGSNDYTNNIFKDELIKVLDELEGIKTMVRWVKVPAPGEMRGEGKWRKFDELWPNGTHWDDLVKTKFLPTKELPEDMDPND